MSGKQNRRSFLLGTAGLVSLAGCMTSAEDQQRESWEDEDAFPSDNNRNRECSIRSLEDVESEIAIVDEEPGYTPFSYAVDGREDIHGTDQNVSIDLSGDSEFNIYITPTENAASEHTQTASQEGEDYELGTPVGIEPLNDHSTEGVTEYETEVTIPDEEIYTIIAIPTEDTEFQDGEVEISLEMECSFYLPFEEYQNQTAN